MFSMVRKSWEIRNFSSQEKLRIRKMKKLWKPWDRYCEVIFVIPLHGEYHASLLFELLNFLLGSYEELWSKHWIFITESRSSFTLLPCAFFRISRKHFASLKLIICFHCMFKNWIAINVDDLLVFSQRNGLKIIPNQKWTTHQVRNKNQRGSTKYSKVSLPVRQSVWIVKP